MAASVGWDVRPAQQTAHNTCKHTHPSQLVGRAHEAQPDWEIAWRWHEARGTQQQLCERVHQRGQRAARGSSRQDLDPQLQAHEHLCVWACGLMACVCYREAGGVPDAADGKAVQRYTHLPAVHLLVCVLRLGGQRVAQEDGQLTNRHKANLFVTSTEV